MWPIMSCLWPLKSSKLIEAFFGLLRLLVGLWGLFWYNVDYWGGLLRPIMNGWGLFWYDAGHCIVVGLWGPLWVVEASFDDAGHCIMGGWGSTYPVGCPPVPRGTPRPCPAVSSPWSGGSWSSARTPPPPTNRAKGQIQPIKQWSISAQ